MKKLLMLAVLVATLGVTAAAESPIKLSLYDNIAWPKPHKTNVVLGIVDNNTPTVHGVSLAIGSSRANEMYGLSAGWIYARSKKLRGLQGAIYSVSYDTKGITYSLVDNNKGSFVGGQLGFVNLSKNMKGVQWGFYDQADKMSGIQFGVINYAKQSNFDLQVGLVNVAKSTKGLQWGFVNVAQRFSGLQLGFVNYIGRIDCGLQLGFVNVIAHNGWLPAMIIANGRF